MSEFYKVGEAITTPCDITYSRQVVRRGLGGYSGGPIGIHSVVDKVFAGAEGVVQNIYTDAKKTVLTVKFRGHRQHVTVIIKGEAHARNPLVSASAGEAQNVSSEAPEESEAGNPTTEEQDVPIGYDDSDVA